VGGEAGGSLEREQSGLRNKAAGNEAVPSGAYGRGGGEVPVECKESGSLRRKKPKTLNYGGNG